MYVSAEILKKLACARFVAHNFGVCTLASEHTLHTRDTRHECALHKPHTLHMWYMQLQYVDVDNELITNEVLYIVLLEIPNEWASSIILNMLQSQIVAIYTTI